MLIAQITDIHLGFDPGNPAEFNRKRLDQVLRTLNEGPNRPDMLLATGDLTDLGDADSYKRLANALSICNFPVHLCLGNHDLRANFSAHFPNVPMADGFVQYAINAGPLRLVFLDTLEEGRHGGAFCEVRAGWLRRILAEDRETPTIIVMHHPPVEVGIDWMNTHPEEQWVTNFTDATEGAPNIKSILCGHIHRPVVVPWRGTAVTICASTAPQVTLDLTPIDPETPDNRPLIIADAPSFALHWWNGRELVTHFESADEHVMLAKFDAGLQPLIRQLIEERPS
jgi:3',5'-cyclic AMP phosphodiesterase CpdA